MVVRERIAGFQGDHARHPPNRPRQADGLTSPFLASRVVPLPLEHRPFQHAYAALQQQHEASGVPPGLGAHSATGPAAPAARRTETQDSQQQDGADMTFLDPAIDHLRSARAATSHPQATASTPLSQTDQWRQKRSSEAKLQSGQRRWLAPLLVGSAAALGVASTLALPERTSCCR